jgi:hypothetical protein
MTLPVLAALIRIVPYALAGYIAYRKGFKSLASGCVYLVVIAILTTFTQTSPELRAILASVYALSLLRHALDL